jgi:hypothetical protein
MHVALIAEFLERLSAFFSLKLTRKKDASKMI